VPLLESVPNVSEGRRPEVIARLAAAAASVPGAHLLHSSSDADHHRTVFTLAGEPEPLIAALLALLAEALSAVDLRRHRGVHPRIGAVDVVPFVPLDGAMTGAVAAARRFGEAAAGRFDLPILLYGEAAARPERRHLADLRRGQFENLAARLATPEGAPDYGPPRPHPSGGATAVGARGFLVAFNAQLATAEVEVARAIAREIREANGGLPGVKALGLPLASRGCAQVSMNLTDIARTPIPPVLARIREEAARRGTRVASTEVVGMLPAAALGGSSPEALQIEGFSEELLLEPRLAALGRGR
jgi:glutamate formiminotransferase